MLLVSGGSGHLRRAAIAARMALFLLAQLRRELGAEVLGLEDLADLDLGLVRASGSGSA